MLILFAFLFAFLAFLFGVVWTQSLFMLQIFLVLLDLLLH